MLTTNELCVYDWILRVHFCADTVVNSYKNYLHSDKFGEVCGETYLKEFKKKAGDLLTVKDVQLSVGTTKNEDFSVYLEVPSPVDSSRNTTIELYATDKHPFALLCGVYNLKENYLKDTSMADYIHLLILKAYEDEVSEIKAELKEASRVVSKCEKNLEVIAKYTNKLDEKFGVL